MSGCAETFGLVGCFVLREDGQIIDVNETACIWLGYTKPELINRPFHVLLGAGGQFFFQSQVLPMLQLKGELEEVYLRMVSNAGTVFPVLVNAVRSTQELVAIQLAFFRIRQRGHLEDELLQAKKMAESASDSKTKFLGMMSHELRTPLGAISLINQMLLAGDYGEVTGEQRDAIESSEGSVSSVTALIDDILNFSRMQGAPVQVSVERLPVNRALERAELVIRHRFLQAGLNLKRVSADRDLTAFYDPNRIQQILLNLLNNALKFTPRGGTVTLSASQHDGVSAIEVSDTGSGIPKEHQQRIFDPFVQLRSVVASAEKPGIGLGLSICRDLAVAMGGNIEVESEVGVGSTFRVLLPQIRGETTST